MNQKKPSVKDKILFFWNTEREHDISKTNGHYPHEAEIITITSEDEDYYYDLRCSKSKSYCSILLVYF